MVRRLRYVEPLVFEISFEVREGDEKLGAEMW